MKFKKGDKVRAIDNYLEVRKGDVLTVKSGPKGNVGGGNYYFKEVGQVMLGNDLELLPAKPLKFLLRYEIDEDPIEEFASLPAVRKRVKELVDKHGESVHSFKVYEIKSVKEVSISRRIEIK